MNKKVETVKQTEININDFTFNYVNLNEKEKEKFFHTHTTSDLRINPFFPINKAPTEKEYPALFEKLKKDKWFEIKIMNSEGKLTESISFDYPKIKLQTTKKEIEKSTDGKKYIEEYAILNMVDKSILDAVMIHGKQNPKNKVLKDNKMYITCTLGAINKILAKNTGGNNDIQIRNTIEKLMKITIKREFHNGKTKEYQIISNLDSDVKTNEIKIEFSLDFFKYFMQRTTLDSTNYLSVIWNKAKELNKKDKNEDKNKDKERIRNKKINMALVQAIIEFMISHEPLGYQYHLSKVLYYVKYIEEAISPQEIDNVKNIKNIKSNLKYLTLFFNDFGIEYNPKTLIFRYVDSKAISNILTGL